METTDAFVGLACRDCDELFDHGSVDRRCVDCGGLLAASYEYGDLELTRGAVAGDSLWRYEPLLPFPRSEAVTMAEGGTPTVACPSLAAELGVEGLLLKDEGRNPTGSIRDRGMSVAVTATHGREEETVALPSTADAGQSAAAYAARAGLSSQVFLPSRANFTAKAMVNVHGGEMSVVEGRYGDAAGAFEDALADEPWHSVAAFETPYRLEGTKTLFFELVADRGWSVPDAIVCPTAHGETLLGIHRGAREFERAGLIEAVPALYAAQPSGCAPVVDAADAGEDTTAPVEYPDTICGALEVPDPVAGSWILDAVDATGGGAVAVEDDQILEAATAVAARAGLEPAVALGAAAAAAEALADDGVFGPADTVALVNTATGNREADVLRSHLMSKGI